MNNYYKRYNHKTSHTSNIPLTVHQYVPPVLTSAASNISTSG